MLLFRRGGGRLQQESVNFENISLCSASAFGQYQNIQYAGDNHHRSGIKAPTNLPDILGSGGFVLDTVAPEMASRKLLPKYFFVVLVLILILVLVLL